jgi:uncharacterized membrane protein YeiH
MRSGVAALAIVSGLGGGILRDVLLQHGAPVALTDYTYLTTAQAGAGVAFAVPFEGQWWERVFPFVDAVALGCWAAAGLFTATVVGAGLCLLARWRGWTLPSEMSWKRGSRRKQ